MLMPDSHWKWKLEPESGILCVELHAGLQFKTAYHTNMLTSVDFSSVFSISHCQFFMDTIDSLEDSGVPFEQSQLLQIGLNATAALSFHKPVKNKSWLYETVSSSRNWKPFQLAWVVNQGDSMLVLVLQQEGDSILCMNLSEQFTSQDGQAHPQFSVIKVLSNRLSSLEQDPNESCYYAVDQRYYG